MKQYNKYSVTVLCLLAIGCLLAITSLIYILPGEFEAGQALTYWKGIATFCVVLVNIYLIASLYKRNQNVLNICLWVSILQMITIESENIAIGLTFGAKAGAVFEFDTTLVSLNLLPILTVVFILMYNRSQLKVNKTLQNIHAKNA